MYTMQYNARRISCLLPASRIQENLSPEQLFYKNIDYAEKTRIEKFKFPVNELEASAGGIDSLVQTENGMYKLDIYRMEMDRGYTDEFDRHCEIILLPDLDYRTYWNAEKNRFELRQYDWNIDKNCYEYKPSEQQQIPDKTLCKNKKERKPC